MFKPNHPFNQLPLLPPSVDLETPLIKLAVQHYQFEAIHPFSDGDRGRACIAA